MYQGLFEAEHMSWVLAQVNVGFKDGGEERGKGRGGGFRRKGVGSRGLFVCSTTIGRSLARFRCIIHKMMNFKDTPHKLQLKLFGGR